MVMRILLAGSVLFFLTACNTTPSAASVPEPAAAAGQNPAAGKTGDGKTADGKLADTKAAEEQKAKADARKQKQKDLRNKRRDLDYARIEQQTGELDRRTRTLTVEAAMQRSAAELEQARRSLDLFLSEQRPREVEDKKISLDRSIYRAEEAKEELGELVAMYEADEFAKTTKELVLKRGRRQAELAERDLAVTKRENLEFEQHSLPQRERELRQKVADAEVERKKAEVDAEKARLELQIAERKSKEKLTDLEEEIADLEKEIAELPEAAAKASS